MIRHPALRDEGAPWLTWWLLSAVVILGVAVALGGIYLNDRRTVSDRRTEIQREGICGILTSLPPGIPSLDAARRDFRCSPGAATKPTPTPTPTVTATVTAKPRPRPRPVKTVTVPGPTIFRPTPMPEPTVTVTKHPPTPARRHHRKPKPRPHPKPSPCIDGICLPSAGRLP